MKNFSKSALTFACAAVVGVGVAMLPTQASARDAKEQTVNESIGNGSASSQTGAKEMKYCFVDTMTGSRIPVKECKTKKQWKAEGVEVPAK